MPYSKLLNKKGEKNSRGIDKGGILPFNGTWIPEFLFALCAGLIMGFYVPYFDGWYQVAFAVLSVGWFYVTFQSGVKALIDGGDGNWKKHQKNTMNIIADYLARRLGIEVKSSLSFSFLFGCVKGFFMSLPFFGLASIPWSLGYFIPELLEGEKDTDKYHHWKELLSGFLYGASLSVFVLVYNLFFANI